MDLTISYSNRQEGNNDKSFRTWSPGLQLIQHFAGALSDSHPETLTDPEHSDQALASSPPQSGDEVKARERPSKETDRRSNRLFPKSSGGHHQVLDRFSQTIRGHSMASDKKDRERDSNSNKVNQ